MAADGVFTEILDAIREPYRLSSHATASPLGNGHINETVLVRDGARHLVVQKINTNVFNEPAALVENALAISSHLEKADGNITVARHLPGADGRYLHGPKNNVRVLEYFPESRSIEVLENPDQARLAAFSFASFSRLLSDFEHSRLNIVIPDFHSPRLRFRQFCNALQGDPAGRRRQCEPETVFALGEEPAVKRWQAMMEQMPVRVCHNDCKINNLLVHRVSGKAVAIIDLDTCMPGQLMTDFGDLVRTCCSPEAEDSPDLERVHARPEILEALRKGYLEGSAGTITPAERESLVPGAMLMCFVVGLRFLTDYLEGDGYFSVDYPEHNLVRARNQFRLYGSLMEQKTVHESQGR